MTNEKTNLNNFEQTFPAAEALNAEAISDRGRDDTGESTMICFSWIKFTDGTVAGMVVHQGTQEECEKVADQIPAVTSSSGKIPKEAGITICTEDEWKDISKWGNS